MKLRDWRGESQNALDCLWPFLQPSCIYIQACHYLSEVTGKDSMIYQTGRQAGRQQALSCYWMEQRGVRESGRAQNRKSDTVIGFLPTSHSSLAPWLSLLLDNRTTPTHISDIFCHIQMWSFSYQHLSITLTLK